VLVGSRGENGKSKLLNIKRNKLIDKGQENIVLNVWCWV